MAHAKVLLDAGLQPADIGIITPYNAQVRARGAAEGWDAGKAGWHCALWVAARLPQGKEGTCRQGPTHL